MDRTARRPAWAGRTRAAGAAVAAALALLASPLAAGGQPPTVPASSGAAGSPRPLPQAPEVPEASAAPRPDASALRILVDDVEPTVAVVGEPVTLRGRIVNDTGEGHRITRVVAQAAWSGLGDRRSVDAWLEGEDDRPTDWRLGATLTAPVVAAGSETPFSLTIPGAVLGGAPGDQSVLAVELSVDNQGDTQESGSGSGDDLTAPVEDPVVSTRTVLTTVRDVKVDTPLEMAWVVPLTLPADPDLVDPSEVVRMRAWAETVGPGSPAREWLEHLTVPGTTWVVDPALLVATHPRASLVEAPPPGEDAPEQPEETQAPDGEPGGEPGDAPTSTQVPATDAPGDASTTGEAGDAGADDAGADDPGAGATAAVTTAPGSGVDEADDGDGSDGGTGTGDEGGDDTEQPVPGAVGTGTPTREDVEGEHVALRAALSQLPEHQLWWLPTDDPDLEAMLPLTDDPTTGASVATAMGRLPEGPEDLTRLLGQGRDDIAWPVLAAEEAPDLGMLSALWTARDADRADAETGREPSATDDDPQDPALAAVVLPREVLAGAAADAPGPGVVTVSGADAPTALTGDTRASALLAASADLAGATGAGATTQRVLADSLMAWKADPAAPGALVVAPPRGSRPDPAVLAELSDGVQLAPWLRPQSADALLERGPADQARGLVAGRVDPEPLGALAPYVQVGESPVTLRTGRSLAEISRQLTGLQQVLADSAGVTSRVPVLGSLWSTRWRTDPQGWTDLWRSLRSESEEVREAVRINPSTINFLSDQGVMRVTVVNTLPVQVEGLHVQMVAGSTILQIVDQPEPLTIGADSRATVSFTARAVTRGQTRVTADLTAPNGTAFGDSAAVDVRVQPTGVWIYWVLGGVAGVLLVLGIYRALRRGPADDGPDTATTADTATTEDPPTPADPATPTDRAAPGDPPAPGPPSPDPAPPSSSSTQEHP